MKILKLIPHFLRIDKESSMIQQKYQLKCWPNRRTNSTPEQLHINNLFSLEKIFGKKNHLLQNRRAARKGERRGEKGVRVGVANQQWRHSSGLSTCESLEASWVREERERERGERWQSGGRDEETRSVNRDVNDRGHGWLRQTTVWAHLHDWKIPPPICYNPARKIEREDFSGFSWGLIIEALKGLLIRKTKLERRVSWKDRNIFWILMIRKIDESF